MPHWKDQPKPQRDLAGKVLGSEQLQGFAEALNVPQIRAKWENLDYPAFCNLGAARLEMTPDEEGHLYQCELKKQGIGVSFTLHASGEIDARMAFSGMSYAGTSQAYQELFAEAAYNIQTRCDTNPPLLRRRRSERPPTEAADYLQTYILHQAS